MPRPKGLKKTGGRDFQKGDDPRRNLDGGPKLDARVAQIKGEIKGKLAEALYKYFDEKLINMPDHINSTDITLGQKIALTFLTTTAQSGAPANVSLLSKLIGLEVEKHEHELSRTLEELVAGSHKKENP